MVMKYSSTLRDAKLAANATTIGNAGKLIIYSGTRPATGGGALSGNTVLAQFTLGSPFAPAPSSGVQSPTLPTAVTASNAGTATWFRIFTSADVYVMDGDVGSDLTLNTTTISSGVQVSVTSWTITAANPA